MLIDWFTVIAQILNFLVLVWLLKRFLYKPILKAIAEREETVKTQIREAEAKMEEAEAEAHTYRQKNQEFDAQRETMLNEATQEAADRRKELLESARKEAEDLRERLEQSVREAHESLQREIAERTREEIFDIARKVMRDLASASLEEHMTRVFLQRLEQVKNDAQLKEALQSAGDELLVRSAFEMPEAQQKEIRQAVAAIAGKKLACRFQRAPEKISGVELTAGGYKIAWSVADYLGSLERRLETLLAEEAESQIEANTMVETHEHAKG